MGRSQSAQISQQSEQNAQQNQQNAQSALGATNAALTKYSSSLDNFMKSGRQTYGENGDYMKDQNAIATTGAAAGSNAIKGNLALHSMATGENTGGYAGSVAESQRQAQRDLTGTMATADATRLQNLTAINQQGVQDSALPAQVQASLYGTSTGAANSAMGTAASASAASPGFLDVFGQDLAAGAGAAAGAAAKGCWIAAEVFDGWTDWRTQLVREWLHKEFQRTRFGRVVVDFYLRHGQAIALWIRRNPRMKPPFRWLFNRALKQARIWAES